MVLTFLERILLLQLLPAEGNVLDLRILADLKKQLAATEEELKDYSIKQEDGKITWDKDFGKDIEVGDRAAEIIKGQLESLDKAGKLTEGHLSLVDKFVKDDSPSVG